MDVKFDFFSTNFSFIYPKFDLNLSSVRLQFELI